MSGGIRHAFTNALYELTEDGQVLVTDGDQQGLFWPDGRWISGELKEADPHLAGWVAGDAMGGFETVK